MHRVAQGDRLSEQSLPHLRSGAPELWTLNHYHDGLLQWHADHGFDPSPDRTPEVEPAYELHNLTEDAGELHNLSPRRPGPFSELRQTLDAQREGKRLLPAAGGCRPRQA